MSISRIFGLLCLAALLVTGCSTGGNGGAPDAGETPAESDTVVTPDQQARMLPSIVAELHTPSGVNWAPIIEATRINNDTVSLSTFRFMVFYKVKCLWDDEFLSAAPGSERRSGAEKELRWFVSQHAFDFARDYYSRIYLAGPIQESSVRQEVRTNCG